MKRVFKYPTGAIIPDGAQFLSTQVETISYRQLREHSNVYDTITKNILVWHYFLVDVEDEPETSS